MRFSMGTSLLAFLILSGGIAQAVTLGQIETFEVWNGDAARLWDDGAADSGTCHTSRGALSNEADDGSRN